MGVPRVLSECKLEPGETKFVYYPFRGRGSTSYGVCSSSFCYFNYKANNSIFSFIVRCRSIPFDATFVRLNNACVSGGNGDHGRVERRVQSVGSGGRGPIRSPGRVRRMRGGVLVCRATLGAFPPSSRR